MNRSSSIVNIETISEAEIDISKQNKKDRRLYDFQNERIEKPEGLNLLIKKELDQDSLRETHKINLNSSLPTSTHRYQSTRR